MYSSLKFVFRLVQIDLNIKSGWTKSSWFYMWQWGNPDPINWQSWQPRSNTVSILKWPYQCGSILYASYTDSVCAANSFDYLSVAFSLKGNLLYPKRSRRRKEEEKIWLFSCLFRQRWRGIELGKRSRCILHNKVFVYYAAIDVVFSPCLFSFEVKILIGLEGKFWYFRPSSP